jgi:hypothetical protein
VCQFSGMHASSWALVIIIAGLVTLIGLLAMFWVV